MTKQHPCGVKSTSAQRLREALATMVLQRGNGASPSALTATSLCELAGMSRNALYRYHPDVVKALHACLLYTSPSPRDGLLSRMPSSA